ncbi:MAG: CGNR zinc finger domain-containing protein [Proteobacteria bacterium]|nr:CGNR zinc finger domain-containing protein [Pseudomonadota bacterium]
MAPIRPPAPASGLPPWQPLGDHLALDFLNTTATLNGGQVEWLGSGEALVSWLVTAGVIAKPPRFDRVILDEVARDAITLREWFRGVLERTKARGPGAVAAPDLKRLNAWLERGASFQRVEQTASGLRTVSVQPLDDAQALLAPLAAAIADLLCHGDLDLVRRCESEQCTMWFYDRTKSHRRRWCSQALCGNRAKAAAFRQRHRAH